jgi:penicillin amidase
LRIGVMAFLLVVVTALGAAAWFYWATYAALPQVDGSLTVPGLSAPVTVVRDARGVPHIRAANLADLYFAQGYVTAQDRLWQMDATRRYAAGEMAEIFGQSMVKLDREQRILGLRQVARQATATLPQRERSQLEDYARGVNAFIEQHRGSLPIEFRLLRYTPQPWRAEDAMLIYAHMAKMLNFSTIYDLLAREKIAAKLPPELTPDLFPTSSWRDLPPAEMGHPVDLSNPEPRSDRIIASGSAQEDNHDHAPSAGVALSPQLLADSLTPGSNNWVLGGTRTQSGKPILANDIHLQHQLPNLWYVAHLECKGCTARDGQPGNMEDMNVAGATLPGVPWVIVGHNDRIAWGFTNLNPTVTDLYVETFNQAGQYHTSQGWATPTKRLETIHVKGKPDVTVKITTTRHGPIIRDLIEGETRPLALRWTLYDTASTDVPFFDLDQARNWTEFRAALSRFAGPSQNVVYADVDGNIGYQATGLIPIRAREKNGPSPDAVLSPFPGDDDSHEWTGYIPFDELPSVYDPHSALLATANGRIVARSYPYTLAYAWGAPYRTERIYKLLNSGGKFRVAQMLTIQMDVDSEFDRFCAERFAYAVDREQNASQRARQAASIMRKWDGQVTADSVAPALIAAARDHLERMILEPRLGADWQAYHWPMESVALEAMLLHRPPQWLPPKFHSWEDLLAAAVEAAVHDAPGKLSDWKWGQETALNLQHPVLREVPMLSRIPLLRRWIGPGRYAQSGNRFTVLQVGPNFGPSLRMTVDLSDLDHSTLNLVNGQSGNPLSRHFDDQWKAWRTGTSFPLPFSDDAVNRSKAHELRLMPH